MALEGATDRIQTHHLLAGHRFLNSISLTFLVVLLIIGELNRSKIRSEVVRSLGGAIDKI